ncbi:MAG: MFS transporter [Anaerolineales bacterium]|nr:MFS transporter [Anaerolineales bacterium]
MANWLEKMKDPDERIVYSYGVGDVSYNLFNWFTSTQTNIYLTDVAMVSVIAAGWLQIVQTVVKIITGFLMGGLIDKKPFKRGMFVPWLQLVPILQLVSYLLLFIVPLVWKDADAVALYTLVGMFVTGILTSAVFTTYSSIFPMVTRDPAKRTIASTFKKMGNEAGKALTGAVYPLLLVFFSTSLNSEASSYVVTTAILGVVSIAIYFWLATDLNKSVEKRLAEAEKTTVKQPKIPFSVLLKALITNGPLLLVTLSGFFYIVRIFIVAPLSPYYYKYVVENPQALALFLSLNSLVPIGFMFLTPFYQKLMGDNTKRAYVVSLLLTAASHLMLKIFPMSAASYTIWVSLGSGFMSWNAILAVSMFGVASDYGEWKFGISVPGISMACLQFSVQAAVFVSTIIRTAALKSIGYQANMAASMELKASMHNVMVFVPIIVLGLAALAALLFPISDSKHREILSSIQERRASAAATAK